MGQVVECRCSNCAATFEVAVGGTLRWETLWCDSCPEYTTRPRTAAVSEPRKHFRWFGFSKAAPPKDPLACSCGGRFTDDATPRCPECHSADVERLRTKLFFD